MTMLKECSLTLSVYRATWRISDWSYQTKDGSNLLRIRTLYSLVEYRLLSTFKTYMNNKKLVLEEFFSNEFKYYINIT